MADTSAFVNYIRELLASQAWFERYGLTVKRIYRQYINTVNKPEFPCITLAFEPSQREIFANIDNLTLYVGVHARDFATAETIARLVHDTLHLHTCSNDQVIVYKCLSEGNPPTPAHDSVLNIYETTDQFEVAVGAGDLSGVPAQQLPYRAGLPYNLDDLSDVVAATPGDGQALVYDSGSHTWIPGTVETDGPPATHHTQHENGGSDEISVAGLSGLLADPQTPLTHTHGGGDITSAVASATNADTLDGSHAAAFAAAGHNHNAVYYTQVQLQTAGQSNVAWGNLINVPGTFTPSAHQHGGGDITSAVANAVNADTLDGKHASEIQAGAHASSHQNGGNDEISVAGLSGLLADAQTPLTHTHGGGDITSAVASATNADTLDGSHAAAFALSGHTHDDRYYTETELSTSGQASVHWGNLSNVPGTFTPATHTHGGGDITTAVASATNADTLDGSHAAAFAASAHDHAGTSSSAFQIDNGNSGPKIKNNSGAFELRNAADAAYADLTVGNLTVNGTQTVINSEVLTVADNIVTLNSNVTGTPTENAGAQVERGDLTNASLIWDESSDSWKAGLAGSEVAISLAGHTHGGGDITSAVASATNADTLDGSHAAAFALSGHTHDDRYYTETELQTSGQASVHWGNLSNVPGTFTPAAHNQAGTTITLDTAGFGGLLSGSETNAQLAFDKIDNLTTANISENTNLYYTDARARGALSGSSPINYNSSTGAISLTQTAITNLSSSLSTGLLKITNGTGLLSTAVVGTDYAGISYANVFTAAQKVNVNSASAFLVEQDGVNDNTLLVDTASGAVGICSVCSPDNNKSTLTIGMADLNQRNGILINASGPGGQGNANLINAQASSTGSFTTGNGSLNGVAGAASNYAGFTGSGSSSVSLAGMTFTGIEAGSHNHSGTLLLQAYGANLQAQINPTLEGTGTNTVTCTGMGISAVVIPAVNTTAGTTTFNTYGAVIAIIIDDTNWVQGTMAGDIYIMKLAAAINNNANFQYMDNGWRPVLYGVHCAPDIVDQQYHTDYTIYTFYAGSPSAGMTIYSYYAANGHWAAAQDNMKFYFGGGLDAAIYYNGTDLLVDTDVVGTGSFKINGLEITKDGFVKPITSTDAAAPNNSIYYSSTQSKLVYKDAGGTVNNLY